MIYTITKMGHQNRNKKRIRICIIIAFCILPLLSLTVQSATSNSEKKIEFDKTKVDLASWLSFYRAVYEFKGYNEALLMLPDSNGLSVEIRNFIKKPSPILDDDFVKYTRFIVGFYPRNKVILSQPITGLNKRQITKFCSCRNSYSYCNKRTCRLPTLEEYRSNIDNRIFIKDKFPNIPELCTSGEQLLVIQINAKTKSLQIIDSITQTHKPSMLYGIRLVTMNTTNNDIFLNNCSMDGRIGMEKAKTTADNRFGLFTDRRDGRTYRTIKIGKHIWMAENLCYTPSNDGGYWDPNKIGFYSYLYGINYTWDTAIRACPQGWHLPSKAEFDDLLNQYPNATEAYNALLISGNSGFSIIFTWEKEFTFFWTSTVSEQKKSDYVILGFGIKSSNPIYSHSTKKYRFPVRCVKDE